MAMSTMQMTVCLLATSFLAGCGGGGSGGGRPPSAALVEKTYLGGIASYDKNRDNVVTCEEWKAAADELFTRVDKSGPGALTPEEYKALASTDGTYAILTFRYFDTDKNGKITKAEFVERPNPAFKVADKNQDCKLDETELASARTAASAPAKAGRKRPGILRPDNIGSSGPGPINTGGY